MSVEETMQKNYLHLLGKTIFEASECQGKPIWHYSYRSREVYIFAGLGVGDTITCVVEDNLIIKVDSSVERREFVRIKPAHNKAYLRHGGFRHEATILELSVNGTSMHVMDGCMPSENDIVCFCTSLRIKPQSLTNIALKGQVYRVFPNENKIAIRFAIPLSTHSNKALLDYIYLSQALAAICIGKPYAVATTDYPDVHALSDILSRCDFCTEAACNTNLTPDSKRNRL
jgi:hypothetical protein